MPKNLRDIIAPRAGRNLPKGEADFLALHTVDVKDYPVKQDPAKHPHVSNVKHQPDSRHGNTTDKESEAVYNKSMKGGA